jgi:hypothetical protein
MNIARPQHVLQDLREAARELTSSIMIALS